MPSARAAEHAELYTWLIDRLRRHANTDGVYVGDHSLMSMIRWVAMDRNTYNMWPQSLMRGLLRLGVAEKREDGYWVDPTVERITVGGRGELTVERRPAGGESTRA